MPPYHRLLFPRLTVFYCRPEYCIYIWCSHGLSESSEIDELSSLYKFQSVSGLLINAMTQSSPTSTFFKPSPPLAFLSASLTLLGIADLAAVTLPEEIFSYYWSSQAPVRLLFFFVLTGYSYAFQPGGALAMRKRLGWDGLNNSVLFTWGFVEMLLWFWVRLDTLSVSLSYRTAVGIRRSSHCFLG